MNKEDARVLNYVFRISGAGQSGDAEGVVVVQDCSGYIDIQTLETPKLVAAFLRTSCETPELEASDAQPLAVGMGDLKFYFTSTDTPSTVAHGGDRITEGPNLQEMVVVMDTIASFKEINFDMLAIPEGPLN